MHYSYTRAVVIVGGGVGGVAAALGVCRTGATAIIIEPYSRIGGQFVTQMVPPDEHPWVETADGSTASYRTLREMVRDWYRNHRDVTAAFTASSQPNPGNAWVSRLSAAPNAWHIAMTSMLAPYVANGKLIILTKTDVAVAVATVPTGAITHVEAANWDTGDTYEIHGQYFIDASELGDFSHLAGANTTVGREANPGTPELHGSATANPGDQQAFTVVAALAHSRATFAADYRTTLSITEQLSYDALKPDFDAFFATRLFDPTVDYAWGGVDPDGPNYWQYRRIEANHSYAVGGLPLGEEVSLINFAVNDYKEGVLIGGANPRLLELARAKSLTKLLVHYLQNDVPRPATSALGAGNGYPGLRLRPDVSGTPDGFAEAPYIREARRLVTIGRVWEWHVGVDQRGEGTTAYQFPDSVGVGHYHMDVHAGPEFPNGLWLRSYTFQIPFMALISNNVPNLLAGGKTLGVSHIVNGAYRLHPTEWNVGEAAGIAAVRCINTGKTPAQLRSTDMSGLQTSLAYYGIQTAWPAALRGEWS